ncbi:MAG TPA: universal stress protein [Methylomirabilota bacterium]
MNFWPVLLVILALALAFVCVPIAFTAHGHWRRPWRLTCPGTGSVAQIQVGAGRAAVGELLGRRPEIDRCSLWPALAGCDQACLTTPTASRRMRRGEAPPRQRGDDADRVIVVPLDGSRGSETVLPAVVPLARSLGATVRLLRIVPPVKEVRDEDDRVVVWVEQETARVENEARDYLRRLAADLADVHVEDAVRIGSDAAAEIIEESEAAGAELIALASRRRRGLAGVRHRSVARQLRRSTTIPLLVVSAGG